MTSCTFAGHREVYQAKIDERIETAIDNLLRTDSEFTFYTGGMGDFDNKCASAVRAAKRKYPQKKISLALVLPYMSNRLNTDKEYYEYCYDEIIIPSEIAGVHYKSAITMRNRWIIDRVNYLIAFVYRDFGGALETVKYARKQGKTIINLAEQN